MIDETVPKFVQYRPGTFVLMLIAGGILFGWLKGRGQPKDRTGTRLVGWLGDDGPRHHGGCAGHGGDTGTGHSAE